MAQPRLQLALAQDGLLPGIFGRVDASGNLRWGTLISGIFMTVTATCVPFEYLDDLISAGILVVFAMTNSCLILMRCESPPHRPHLLGTGLVVYNGLCFMTGIFLSHTDSFEGTASSITFAIVTGCTALYLAWKCPHSSTFGRGPTMSESPSVEEHVYFQAPCVPLLPCLGIFVNWYLISQLDAKGLLMLLVYLGLATGFYFSFGAKHSIGNSRGWMRGTYEGLAGTDLDATAITRSISLPRLELSGEALDPHDGDGLFRSQSVPSHKDHILRHQPTV